MQLLSASNERLTHQYQHLLRQFDLFNVLSQYYLHEVNIDQTPPIDPHVLSP